MPAGRSPEGDYRCALRAMRSLLWSSQERLWALDVTIDLLVWDIGRRVRGHLQSYGSMGSLDDLYLENSRCGTAQDCRPWANGVFRYLLRLAFVSGCRILELRGKLQPWARALPPPHRPAIYGTRCDRCSRLWIDSDSIEPFVVDSVLDNLADELLRTGRCRQLSNLENLYSARESKQVRRDATHAVSVSEIPLIAGGRCNSPCPSCGGELRGVRWIVMNRDGQPELVPCAES
jgi:hypothetical protein